MSWDKNTVNLSDIDALVYALNILREPYILTVLGTLQGYGLNDDENKVYSIRKLEFRDYVVLEQMRRTHDCDTDDIIVSYRARKGDIYLDNWELEVYTDSIE